MTNRRRENSNLLKKYNSLKSKSAIIWTLCGIGIFAFGIYYSEIFEIVFGILALIYGIYSYRTRHNSLSGICRIERNKLSFLAASIVIFSLVNPIGNIAVIYDLFKRDYVIKGGFDEK